MFNQGLLNGTVHTCVGQELIGVFASKYLNENDFVVSNHRGHGHYIAKTGDTKGLLAELLGKVSGCSGGVGGSQHIYNTNYMSNGIQGGMVPIAAGVALARKAYESNSVSLAYIGDGTLGQGILYEAMHLSSMHSVPLVLVLENNGYSQSTSHKDNFSGSIEQRALGFGFKYFESSTFDIEDLDLTFDKAISAARETGSPVLVHVETYRLNSHSKGDDNRYEDEIEEYKTRDLINQFSSNFINESIKIRNNINSIVEEIQADEKLVTFDKTDRYVEQDCEFGDWEVDPDEEGLRINELIYKALKSSLQQEDMYLLGEDICNQVVIQNITMAVLLKLQRI